MSIEEYFNDWLRVVDTNILKNTLDILNREYSLKSILPDKNKVFKAFSLCKYRDLKIVFISQDPYPQRGVATGILFGNKKEIEEKDLSPSLKIIKNAAINFEIPHYCINFDQTLESWAKQGILMLNSALTVEEGNIGSHTMIWRPFMISLLKNLSLYNSGIIYVLFGEQAQILEPYINKNCNIILKEKHPAYYARIGKSISPNLFIKINDLTNKLYNTHINWFEELN